VENSSGISFEDFVKNPVLELAFIRSLEVLGEAVKKLSLNLREQYSEIPYLFGRRFKEKCLYLRG
jgi:uncharacterized protein with HEPN domain